MEVEACSACSCLKFSKLRKIKKHHVPSCYSNSLASTHRLLEEEQTMATAVTTRQTSPEKKVSEKPTADGFTVKARMKNMKARYLTICSTSVLVK